MPCTYLSLNFFRIHDAVAEKLPIVDVDGSYLYRKQQALLHSGVQVAPLPPPAPPLAGWEVVTDSNVDTVSASIPTVTSGKLYMRPLLVAYNLILHFRDLVHLPGLWYRPFSNRRSL